MGASPVSCDTDLSTLNIDSDQIVPLVTASTAGIILVHLFGLCADMMPVVRIAKKDSLWIVEDVAYAFGAWYYGKCVGAFGNTGCFNFHPRKSITIGEVLVHDCLGRSAVESHVDEHLHGIENHRLLM